MNSDEISFIITKQQFTSLFQLFREGGAVRYDSLEIALDLKQRFINTENQIKEKLSNSTNNNINKK